MITDDTNNQHLEQKNQNDPEMKEKVSVLIDKSKKKRLLNMERLIQKVGDEYKKNGNELSDEELSSKA